MSNILKREFDEETNGPQMRFTCKGGNSADADTEINIVKIQLTMDVVC